MDTHKTLKDIVDAKTEGKLERNDYWSLIKDYHNNLRTYSFLIKRAGLQQLEISDDDLIVELKNGLRFSWNPEDVRTAISCLVNDGVYETQEMEILKKFATGNSTIFDIGANVGWYSLNLALLLKGTLGKIYSFEPVPDTFMQLQKNINHNCMSAHVYPFNIALGDREGDETLYLSEFNGSVAASSRKLFEDSTMEAHCSITTLDSFVASQDIESIDIIKCDVEGAELSVLRGGKETIAQYKPAILLEILRKWTKIHQYSPNDIITFLRDLGYICYRLSETDGKNTRIEPIDEINDSTIETNFLFLHKDKDNPC